MTNSEITIGISEARSRKETHWPYRRILWSDLVKRCTTTTYTGETVAQYKAMDRDSQGRVKDVGGFCCAMFADNRRKKANVKLRSGLTYDLDYCDCSAQEITASIHSHTPDIALLVYSTHKHTRKSPRLRVVVPLAKPIPPDIYAATARKMAEKMGILNWLDSTTFDVERLFYWPSTPSDGEFYKYVQEGVAVDANAVINEYHNWTDMSLWPRTPREKSDIEVEKRRQSRGGQQEDPTAKDGWVGAFCRAYSPIQRGIDELLPEIYRRTYNRYTFVGASTSGGVVVYDDKWVFSHHDTDPAGGQLLNIFDLCRVHWYGDKDARSTQEGEQLPSYKLMLEFCRNDERTKQYYTAEQINMLGAAAETHDPGQSPQSPAVETTQAETVEPEDWMGRLTYKKNGVLDDTICNITEILANDPRLKATIRLNRFTMNFDLNRPVPWSGGEMVWTDADDSQLAKFLEKNYGFRGKKEKIRDAVTCMAHDNAYHPVLDYFDSLPKWDGVPRVDTLLIDYLGAEDNELNRAVTRLALVGSVARIKEPGCKLDFCFVMTGPEGIGKSYLLSKLYGEWFNETFSTAEGKDSHQGIQGCWGIELSELEALRKSEVETFKAFISTTKDTYRPSYGRRNVVRRRSCVFWGTTNDDSFLKGSFGNRKIKVIPVGVQKMPNGKVLKRKSLKTLDAERDQIWAEALSMYRPHMPLILSEEMEDASRTLGETYNIDKEREAAMLPALITFLEMDLPPGWEDYNLIKRRQFMASQIIDPLAKPHKREKFSVCEFICESLGKDLGSDNYKYLARYVGQLMKQVPGWSDTVTISRHAEKVYGRQKAYKRLGVVDDEEGTETTENLNNERDEDL